MYLIQLDKKSQQSFFCLAYNLIGCDGEIHELEKASIEICQNECDFPQQKLEDIYNGKILAEEEIKYLNSSYHTVKKMIFFELCRMSLSDGKFAEEEKEFLEKLHLQLQIDGTLEDYMDIAEKYVSLVFEINEKIMR